MTLPTATITARAQAVSETTSATSGSSSKNWRPVAQRLGRPRQSLPGTFRNASETGVCKARDYEPARRWVYKLSDTMVPQCVGTVASMKQGVEGGRRDKLLRTRLRGLALRAPSSLRRHAGTRTAPCADPGVHVARQAEPLPDSSVSPGSPDASRHVGVDHSFEHGHTRRDAGPERGHRDEIFRPPVKRPPIESVEYSASSKPGHHLVGRVERVGMQVWTIEGTDGLGQARARERREEGRSSVHILSSDIGV